MKRISHIIGCICALALSSCSSMYIPSMGNAPLLNTQGDIQAEVSVTTNAVQLGGAYAISDHLAGMANMNISYGNISNSYDIYTTKNEDSTTLADLTNWGKFNNRNYEVGVGYYNIFNNDHFKMEAFGGLGYCHATDENTHITNAMEKYNTNYTMLFGQVNTGLSTQVCDFGLAFRVAPTFHSFKWETENYNTPNSYQSGTEHFTLFHVEPLLFLRLGWNHFKISAKAGISYPFETQSYKDAQDIIPNSTYIKTTLVHFSLGACFSFNNAK